MGGQSSKPETKVEKATELAIDNSAHGGYRLFDITFSSTGAWITLLIIVLIAGAILRCCWKCRSKKIRRDVTREHDMRTLHDRTERTAMKIEEIPTIVRAHVASAMPTLQPQVFNQGMRSMSMLTLAQAADDAERRASLYRTQRMIN